MHVSWFVLIISVLCLHLAYSFMNWVFYQMAKLWIAKEHGLKWANILFQGPLAGEFGYIKRWGTEVGKYCDTYNDIILRYSTALGDILAQWHRRDFIYFFLNRAHMSKNDLINHLFLLMRVVATANITKLQSNWVLYKHCARIMNEYTVHFSTPHIYA